MLHEVHITKRIYLELIETCLHTNVETTPWEQEYLLSTFFFLPSIDYGLSAFWTLASSHMCLHISLSAAFNFHQPLFLLK